MTKQDIYILLDNSGITYQTAEHQAVFTIEQMDALGLSNMETVAKNLFVRDDKKRSYYLISVCGHKRVDLKEFRRANGLRPLSFASAEELSSILSLTPGSVTPMGLLNDENHAVTLYLDKDFLQNEGIIGVHPNENTATVWLKAADLIAVLRDHGVTVTEVNINQ